MGDRPSGPQDILTGGTALKVFKYTITGSLLGSWKIDPANTHPTGITINPNNVSDIWIVDIDTKKVYQYTAAASRTSGSQNAAASFALAANNTNPQGIADPPVAGDPFTFGSTPIDTLPPVNTSFKASAPSRGSGVAAIASLAGHDAIWASLGGEILTPAHEPVLNFSPVNRALPSSSVSGERNASDRRTSLAPVSLDGAGSDPSAAELLEEAPATDDIQASTTAMDAFFAMIADHPINE